MDWTEVIKESDKHFEQMHTLLRNSNMLPWAGKVLFTCRWVIGISLILVPWIVWFLIKKKGSTGRLYTQGF